jgi:hypothetical protein
MKDYVKLTKPVDLVPNIVEAFKEIKHYTVTFVLEDNRAGSGTLVNTCGYDGILTAHHVAKPVLEGEEFALCEAEYKHSLYLRSDRCEHVPVGHIRNNPHPENGPDLSFIIIRDSKVLATLRSIKSFFYLETKDLEYFQSPLERMHWAISGSPDEAKKVIGAFADGPVMSFQNFVGAATFQSRVIRGEFDFINLKMASGIENFPKDCEGMSGGGIWLLPLSIENEDPKTIRHEAPILAGVSFYQSVIEKGARIITGHGYESIYSRLREALKALK